jgi:hypothetical protein
MMTTSSIPLLVASSITVCAFCGCATQQRLEPASGVLDEQPVAAENGVELRVLADAWEGRRDVERYATPVFVSITNNSGERIRLDPNQFRLVAKDRVSFDAVAPSAITSQIEPSTAGYAMPDEASSIIDLHMSALDEQVLGQGETRAGFVFFEKGPRSARDLTMTARFESLDSGDTVASVALPLSAR